MHMLCLITYKVRSENRYGFFETRSENGLGEMAFFGLKLGLDLDMWAAHPHQKFQGVPPTPGCIAYPNEASIVNKESPINYLVIFTLILSYVSLMIPINKLRTT